jgi:hypothetical protein
MNSDIWTVIAKWYDAAFTAWTFDASILHVIESKRRTSLGIDFQ